MNVPPSEKFEVVAPDEANSQEPKTLEPTSDIPEEIPNLAQLLHQLNLASPTDAPEGENKNEKAEVEIEVAKTIEEYIVATIISEDETTT